VSHQETGFTETINDFGTHSSSLGIDMDELVRITFLEQSAKYFGVYINHDRYSSIIDEQYDSTIN